MRSRVRMLMRNKIQPQINFPPQERECRQEWSTWPASNHSDTFLKVQQQYDSRPNHLQTLQSFLTRRAFSRFTGKRKIGWKPHIFGHQHRDCSGMSRRVLNSILYPMSSFHGNERIGTNSPKECGDIISKRV